MKKYTKGRNLLTPAKLWHTKSKTITLLIMTMLIIPAIGSFAATATAATSASALHVDGKYIKDSSGNIVYLHGVNSPDFANDADGLWVSDSHVKQKLDTMKSWGMNTVRSIFAVNQWKYDTIDYQSSMHNREAIKRFITFAGERGMYVILTGYTLKSTVTVGCDAYQDPLPYPPYQTTPGGSSVISSQQDFVNFWTSVANELKGYPNVIFELWNEPQGTTSVLNTWLSVSQQCITAIRNTGAQNLVLLSGTNWGSSWVDVDTTYREDMSWVFNRAFTGGNIIYSVHMYSQALKGSITASYAYSAVDRALSLMRYYDVANNYPLVVSEICPNMDSNTAKELVFFQNSLSLFNSHGISYTAWGFWSATRFRLLSSEAPNYTPNAAGNILKNALAAGTTTQTTTTSTTTPTPTPTTTTTTTQTGTFNIGDRVQNIYATSNIGTITKIDASKSWAEVQWDSGQKYGIAFNCLKLLSASTTTTTPTPTPTPTTTTTTTQSSTFRVGDRIQNIYATSNIGTIVSIDTSRNWAEVQWDSGQKYGIAFNCMRKV